MTLVWLLCGLSVLSAQTDPLTVRCPDAGSGPLTFSTGPFSCSATIRPPAPLVSGACWTWTWTFEIWEPGVDEQTGESVLALVATATDHLASGIVPGSYLLRYIVEDNCGRRQLSDCELVVADQIAPVGACPGEIALSIDAQAAAAGGYAALRAEDMGGGGTDNCPGLQRAVRRSLASACLPAYTAQVFELTWPDDFAVLWDAAGETTYYLHGGDTLLMKREEIFYTWWSDAVWFSCCDAGNRPQAELRLTDAAGNQTDCRSEILVIDELPPGCRVAAAIELPCTELDFDPVDTEVLAARFGPPEAVVMLDESCPASIEEAVTWMPDECGAGTIERRFRVTDASGLASTCRQVITVAPVVRYAVELPGDDSARRCEAGPGPEVVATDLACNLLAVTSDTTRLDAEGGACARYSIRHRLINWCEFSGDEGAEPLRIERDLDGDGDFSEPTFLTVDYTAPPDRILQFWSEDADGRRQLIRSLSREAYERLMPGLFEYTRLVKVLDEEAPAMQLESPSLEFCAGAEAGDCSGVFNILFSVRENCDPDAVRAEDLRLLLDRDPERVLTPETAVLGLQQNGPSFVITGQAPLGIHRLQWELTDACGNTALQELDVRIVDCRAAPPLCRPAVVVQLQPVDADGDGRAETAMNTVFASDLLQGVGEDCSGPLSFSLNRAGEPADAALQSLTLTCEDLDQGSLPVELNAWDGAGNRAVCTALIVVEDERNRCGELQGDGALGGLIATEQGLPVAGVEVQLSGPVSRSLTTKDDGRFTFSGLEENADYTVRPWLDRQYLNGVSTFDLVLISKHVLRLEPITTPYALIAADVNNSGTVTTLDLIQLRKVILNTENKFRQNSSWRFVDAAYRFPNPANPWQSAFPESVTRRSLQGTVEGIAFVAVKVGDVSGNALPAGLEAPVQPRDARDRLLLQAPALAFAAGQLVEAPVVLPRLDMLDGYQFTLEFDPGVLQLHSLENALPGAQFFGDFTEEGLLTVSWIRAAPGAEKRSGTSAGDDAPLLFRLLFRARQAGRLEAALRIGSRKTPAEAYDRRGALLEPVLAFAGQAVEGDVFELQQNVPNPFRSFTDIRFRLPVDGQVELLIHDVRGRLVHRQSAFFPSGSHLFQVNRRQLPAAGLYIYTLQSGPWKSSRRMVVGE